MDPGRAINWLDSTCRSVRAAVPEASENAPYITERLSALLLQRLPHELSAEILALLPRETVQPSSLRLDRRQPPDSSIGFATFVEVTRHVLGMSDLLDSPRFVDSEEQYAELCQSVAEAFLWAVVQELPVELKFHIAPYLPSDLRCRMNLYSGYSGAEQVA